MEKRLTRTRAVLFLALTLGFYFACWLIAVLLPEASGQAVFHFLAFPVVFMGAPALATLLTRRLTGDRAPWNLDLKVWKNKPLFFYAGMAPALAILLGMVVFYLVFPEDLDLTAARLSQTFGAYGAPAGPSFTVPGLLAAGLGGVVLSGLFVPYWFLGLGEEIGWQGYLLPKLCALMPTRRAVLLNGALWGAGHAPLIYFGFNYGLDYPGAPWGGILMMVLVCMVLSVWTSWVTLRTGNCMYAAVFHGSVDLIGEWGAMVSLGARSTLLGPNPSGILGMSVLLAVAVVLLVRKKPYGQK